MCGGIVVLFLLVAAYHYPVETLSWVILTVIGVAVLDAIVTVFGL